MNHANALASITLAAITALVLVGHAAAQQRTLYDKAGKHVGSVTTDTAGTRTIYGVDGRVTARESTDSQGTTTVYGADGRRLGTTTTPRETLMPTKDQIEAAVKAMMQHGLLHYRPTIGGDELMARVRELARVALEAAEAHDLKRIVAHRTFGRRIEQAKEAFMRRFGKDVLPITTLRYRDDDGRDCVRIHGKGAWAEYAICNKRIKRLRESQGTLSINQA